MCKLQLIDIYAMVHTLLGTLKSNKTWCTINNSWTKRRYEISSLELHKYFRYSCRTVLNVKTFCHYYFAPSPASDLLCMKHTGENSVRILYLYFQSLLQCHLHVSVRLVYAELTLCAIPRCSDFTVLSADS